VNKGRREIAWVVFFFVLSSDLHLRSPLSLSNTFPSSNPKSLFFSLARNPNPSLGHQNPETERETQFRYPPHTSHFSPKPRFIFQTTHAIAGPIQCDTTKLVSETEDRNEACQVDRDQIVASQVVGVEDEDGNVFTPHPQII
jgi:hypothetical protein